MTDWGWPRDVDDAVDNHSLKVHDGQHLVIHRRVDVEPREAVRTPRICSRESRLKCHVSLGA